MGKPLSQVMPNGAGLFIQPDAISDNPELSALVMKCIATWSHIDNLFVQIATHLFESNRQMIAAMLDRIISQKAKNDAIREAAKFLLDSDTLKIYDRLEKFIESSRRTRNKFAHHIWARSNELPNCLLLVDPKEHSQTMAKFWSEQPPGPETGPDPLKIMVYTEADLQQEAEDARNAQKAVAMFTFSIRDYPKHVKSHTELETLLKTKGHRQNS